jgi:hypothetical protein
MDLPPKAIPAIAAAAIEAALAKLNNCLVVLLKVGVSLLNQRLLLATATAALLPKVDTVLPIRSITPLILSTAVNMVGILSVAAIVIYLVFEVYSPLFVRFVLQHHYTRTLYRGDQ